uniref:Uncharacterized protein n=1 Tax=Solanum lycopersicum TaxID=4081 RepID=A0A3Q7JLH6_SOLLC
NCCCGSDAMF